ncbi:MAG: TonB-dependent vitamin B12 receptor [Pseudomonadota bacterium]
MKKITIALLLVILNLPSAFTDELDPIIVTATRTPQTVDETLASVTVITREDIERQQARTIIDLLTGLPGVSISNNGGDGQVSSLFLRGASSNQVLFLVDGVKTGSVTTGSTPFQNIPVDLIERIEIVRGPRSSLYGSEAIGGVVQIFTRKGGGKTRTFASIGGGKYDSFDASAGVSGGGDKGWYNLSVNRSKTNGFDSCENQFMGGCFNQEPDDDGYKEYGGSAQAGYQFDSGVEVDIHALRSEGEVEFDGFFNESDTRFQVVGGSLSFSPMDIWRVKISAGSNWDESRNKGATSSSKFDSRRDSLSIQSDTFISDNHNLTFGFDYQEDKIDSSTDYDEDSRDNKGIYAQYLGLFGSQDLQLSLRNDDNEQFGNQTTGNAAWGFTVEEYRFFASYGTAFKAPTFNDLYFPGFSNPNLDPEESRSYEGGISGNNFWGNWAINIYQTYIDDLIVFDSVLSQPINVDEARIRGFEAVINTSIYKWQINTNITLLDPEITNGVNDGNVLPRRARQTFRLDLDRDYGRFSIGSTIYAADKRYDDLANTEKLGRYATVGLRSEVIITNSWRLQGRIENLFDKDYQTAKYYNQPGRSGFVTLRYSSD